MLAEGGVLSLHGTFEWKRRPPHRIHTPLTGGVRALQCVDTKAERNVHFQIIRVRAVNLQSRWYGNSVIEKPAK